MNFIHKKPKDALNNEKKKNTPRNKQTGSILQCNDQRWLVLWTIGYINKHGNFLMPNLLLSNKPVY